jgi:hypothetical protein
MASEGQFMAENDPASLYRAMQDRPVFAKASPGRQIVIKLN